MIAPHQTYALGRGYSVEFSFDGQRFAANWLPHLPPPEIGRELLPTYREARGQFLASLAPYFGPIVVVDV